MAITSKLLVNWHIGRRTHVQIKDTAGGFTTSTDVVKVEDANHIRFWHGEVVSLVSANILQIRLTGRQLPTLPTPTGDITVTLTNTPGGPSYDVPLTPVDYVDDDA